MKSRKKARSNIPSIIVIILIIAFVGVGLRSGSYINNHFSKKQQQGDVKSPESSSSTVNNINSLSYNYRQIRKLSDCQVIIQNSLFEQLGGRKIERQIVELTKKTEAKPEIPQPRPAPPNYIILTGIVYLDGEPLALIEDSSKGKSYFLKKGDKIRDYIVEDITGKEITLVNENSRIVQSLGSKTYFNTDSNMLASSSVISDSSNNVQTKSMSESVLSENKDSNLSLIEQMKNRRKKELGQE